MAKKGKSRVPISGSKMSDRDYSRFSQFIYNEVGIKLPPSKKTMVEARLQKRMRFLDIKDHAVYVDYLFSSEGMAEELINLIDVVTTNTTDFFREPQHFDLMKSTILPEFHKKLRGHVLRIWSAGCSTGMEPYTLAIVCSEYAELVGGMQFRILATDISTQVLQQALRGIYDEERIAVVPKSLKYKYFMRSRDRSKKLVRLVPEVRRVVQFHRLNFMEEFALPKPMHIIFCRNVVIYFDKTTQERLFLKLCRNLTPGGYLFIGHSESLAGMELPLTQVAPTIYQRS